MPPARSKVEHVTCVLPMRLPNNKRSDEPAVGAGSVAVEAVA